MSRQLSASSMEVVTLKDGRFGVRIFAQNLLPRMFGEFDTREEADAWVLQQSLLTDEAVADHGVLRPGPSLDVT